MQFDAFAREHGLIVEHIDAGRWVRVPTNDHPRSRNGAYRFMGDIGWVHNWATMTDVAIWRPEAHEVKPVDMARINAEAALFLQRQRDGWARAARTAAEMIKGAKQAEHGYLSLKGLGTERGLVLPDESLMVPMRQWRTNALVGAQMIKWLAEERRYDKKMLPGTRAKGAMLRLGTAQAPRSWLVEGYATGLSVAAALRLVQSRDAVVICFSAGNLAHVARLLPGQKAVFADHDESGCGERTAKITGLPYCMSDVVGEDANDMHVRSGIFRVAALMRSV